MICALSRVCSEISEVLLSSGSIPRFLNSISISIRQYVPTLSVVADTVLFALSYFVSTGRHINVLKEHKHHKALYFLKAVVVFCICSERIAYSGAFEFKLNGDFFDRKSVRIYKFGSCSDNCAVIDCV